MGGKGVSTPAVVAAGAGALVLWSAMKGVSVTSGLRSLLTGKQPSTANVEPAGGLGIQTIGDTGGSSGGGSGATGSAIADHAMSYVGQGHVYRWGGGSPSGWDCSGFCNWVIGHDLGASIPGHRDGRYSGHGPTTLQWAVFGQHVPSGQEQPGDLVVWPTQHMGIVSGGGQMINCPGPNGTPAPIVSSYHWGAHVFRRVALVTAAGIPGITVGIPPGVAA